MKTLTLMVKDVVGSKEDLFVALFVAAVIIGLSYGYLIGLVAGTIIAYAVKKKSLKLFE